MAEVKNDGTRTPGYQFTVTTKEDPELLELRAHIKEHNKIMRQRFKDKDPTLENGDNLLEVRLRGRGKRSVNGVPVHYGASQSLRHAFAERFDVYVGESTDSWLYWRCHKEGIDIADYRKEASEEHLWQNLWRFSKHGDRWVSGYKKY